jgi:tRNA(fMet)-specific endonuclease VapC
VTFLLDTNHAIAHLNGHPHVASRLAAYGATGDVFAISATVLGELYFGAYASQKMTENLAALATFLSHVDFCELTIADAEEFGKIQAEQRAKGKPIPTADAQIAAVARLHSFTLLTNDAHFQSVTGLLTDDWLI